MAKKNAGKWYTFSWINLSQSQRRFVVQRSELDWAEGDCSVVIESRLRREEKLIDDMVPFRLKLTPDYRLQLIPEDAGGASFPTPKDDRVAVTLSYCGAYVRVFSKVGRIKLWSELLKQY